MRLNKKILGIPILIGGLLLFSPNQAHAAIEKGFRKIPITGTTSVNITYDVDDTKSIMDYSGAYRYAICNEFGTKTCSESDFVTYNQIQTSGGQATNAGTGGINITSTGNKVVIQNHQIGIEEGIYNVCIRNQDFAVNGAGTGNFSDILCSEVFHDTSGPIATSIILNGANHWINTGEVPVRMTITDNRAGIKEITYDSGNGRKKIDFAESGNTISCVRDEDPAEGDGSYVCTVVATLHTNFYRKSGDMGFIIEDKVGNKTSVSECIGSYKDPNTGKGSCIMYYDGNKPSVDGKINSSDEGGASNAINNNTGHLEIHAKDEPTNVWTVPSGIEQVIVQDSDGSGEPKWVLDERNNPDPKKTFDEVIKEFVFNRCPASAKITVIDKAQNKIEIITSPMTCNYLSFYSFRVLDVVNPKIYNLARPFEIRNWVFEQNPITNESGYLGPVVPTSENKYGDLPKALAGANVTWDISYLWEGETASTKNGTISGYYTVLIENQSQRYTYNWTKRLSQSDFIKTDQVPGGDKEGVIYQSKPQTFTIPRDTPPSKENSTFDSEKTYVTIQVILTMETKEGTVSKYQTRVFPLDGNEAVYGKIAEVTGSIDDYIWFGELN